ncbi:small ribosomal subunit protein uS2m-like [Silene latifolia]|uniref:small ribosomal subunit protein uS2m-like n=1 Tax=Silene latifolia TaxID=37657 RepID=UPI003D76ED90
MGIHSAVIQKLLTTNSHVGRRIISHHLKPYVHGTRNSLPIIDSEKTLISLRSALNFIGNLIRTRVHSTKPARFLFVNTNPLYDHIFDHMTRLTGFGSFFSPQAQSWRHTGFLTNPYSPRLFRRARKLCFPPINLPDCVVVVDLDKESSVVDEAYRVGVPVVALVDSTTSVDHYKKIAYPIVVGRDSVQFVYLMCNLITKTFMLEKGITRTQHTTALDLVDEDASSEQATLSDTNETTEELKTVPQSGSPSEQATLKDANETTEELKTVPQSGPPSEQATLKDVNETTEELKTGPQSA